MGLPGAKGRLCPQVEHACRTQEGQRLWDAVRRASGWAGGGMTPVRMDRAAIRARLEDIPAWILETLMDAFEPTALTGLAQSRAKQLKNKSHEGAAPESSCQEQSDD